MKTPLTMGVEEVRASERADGRYDVIVTLSQEMSEADASRLLRAASPRNAVAQLLITRRPK